MNDLAKYMTQKTRIEELEAKVKELKDQLALKEVVEGGVTILRNGFTVTITLHGRATHKDRVNAANRIIEKIKTKQIKLTLKQVAEAVGLGFSKVQTLSAEYRHKP